MKPSFWIKRTSIVLVSAFVILATVYWLRGNAPGVALREAGIWATVSAGVYLVFGLIRMRNPKARECAMCAEGGDGVSPGDSAHKH